MTVWQEIKVQAIDNITQATPVMAALKMKGCLVPQDGGDLITRTIDYALPNSLVQGVSKGTVFATGDFENKTMARWPFRTVGIPVQRDLISDRENSGKHKITDYVTNKLNASRRALVEKQSTGFFKAQDTSETGHTYVQSLNDVIPTWSTDLTTTGAAGNIAGTWGLITRPTTYNTTTTAATYGQPSGGNTWWGPMYYSFQGAKELNMVADMTHLFNTIRLQGQEDLAPDLIVVTQSDFELYETTGLAMSQMVKSEGGLVDLGFQTLKFKGADMIVTGTTGTTDVGDGLYSGASGSDMLFICSSKLEYVYDSGLWFEMDDWTKVPRELTRITKILYRAGLVCAEPRKMGRLVAGPATPYNTRTT
jgi:hypothetical protein